MAVLDEAGLRKSVSLRLEVGAPDGSGLRIEHVREREPHHHATIWEERRLSIYVGHAHKHKLVREQHVRLIEPAVVDGK
jgi:hypothetical protein